MEVTCQRGQRVDYGAPHAKPLAPKLPTPPPHPTAAAAGQSHLPWLASAAAAAAAVAAAATPSPLKCDPIWTDHSVHDATVAIEIPFLSVIR